MNILNRQLAGLDNLIEYIKDIITSSSEKVSKVRRKKQADNTQDSSNMTQKYMSKNRKAPPLGGIH